MEVTYPACFYKEKNGYSIVFPDLNHLATCADTLEAAKIMAVDCLAGYLFIAYLEKVEVPPPSNIADIECDVFISADSFCEHISVDVFGYAEEHFGCLI